MPYDNAEYLPQHLQVLLVMDRLLPDASKWCKGQSYRGTGDSRSGCLFFGILKDARTSLGLPNTINTWDYREYQALARLVPEGYDLGQSWNDAPETTFSDIKALLQEAIELESAKVYA